MTAITQINITAKDSTAGAFASANNNLSGLASSALKATAGIAGIGLSIAGAVESVKGIAQATIQFQQFNSTLQIGLGSAQKAGEALGFVRAESQRLGLDLAVSADQFAKLAAASKGTALEGKATRDIFSAMSEAATVLGLSADETRGALNAFQQMISKGKVQAEELRGQLGERLPGAFGLAARAMGVTTAELDKLLAAGKVTADDLLPKLAVELNKTFGPQAEESAKGLQSQINRMNTALFDLKIAIGESGLINFLSSGIELATKLGNALTSAFGGGAKLNPIEKQVELIKSLETELERMQGINAIIPISDFIFSKKESDLIKFRIEAAKEDLEKLKAIAAIPVPGGKPTLPGKVAEDAGSAKKAIDELNKAQTFAIAREHEYIKLLQIERKAHADLVKPYLDSADAAEKRLSAMNDEVAAMKLATANGISLEKSIELTTIARLEEKKVIEKDSDVVAQIQREIDARKGLVDLIPEQKKLVDQTRDSTDQISQLWVQAGRNIQSTLANSIFNIFDDGLKGMVKNVVSAVGRIASEFAGLKLAQGIGLAGLFGTSGAASASSGGGLNALNLASAGTSILSGIRGGFGIPSAIGNIGMALPGSVGSFFGGLAGSAGTQAAAEAGALALWGSSGASAGIASGIGAGLAAAAGPLMVAFAATQAFKMLAGDKRIGGGFGKFINKIGDIPILGDFIPVVPLLNSLFGRGPLKQQGTLLEGKIGAQGFESGMLQTRFKAKGGLFRSDKIDYSRVDAVTGETFTDNGKLTAFTAGLAKASKVIFGAINESTKQTSSSLRGVAKDLGLATSGIDDFSYSLSILTDKGKMISEEQIGEEIGKISEAMARNLLPAVDSYARFGETAFQTVTRLGAEFKGLESGAMNLGASAAFAKQLISDMSIETRTAFVNLAGGLENIQTLTGYFAENYLTPAEKIAPLIDGLVNAAKELGYIYTTDVTKDQVKALIQSQEITGETRVGLLKLLPAFDTVRNTLDAMSGATGTAADAINDFASIVQGLRNDLNSTYQSERSAIESTISRFKDLAGQLRSSRESLALGALSPLTPGQKLDEARAQFNQTRLAAAGGDQDALAKLPTIAQSFLQASQTYNASGAAYLSDFGMVNDVLKNAETSALSQIDIATNQLAALDESVKNLVDIKDNTKTVAELLKELKATVLSGPGNPGISTDQIKSYLSANPGLTPDQVASAAAQYGVSGSQLSAAGYNTSSINQSLGGSSVSDQQIRAFVDANRSNPMAIYNAAVQNGISSTRLSSASGIAIADIQEFVRRNNLPSFAKGTDFISRSGLAMVHRAEAIVPSSTTDEIKKLREELAKLREEQNRQTGDMINVTDITNRQNAQVIAKALADAERTRQWSDRSKAALA